MPRPEKKKFGKNLNKLVQPTSQAPPIAAPHEKWSAGTASTTAGRHGLLLLSAQKKANGSSLFVNHSNIGNSQNNSAGGNGKGALQESGARLENVSKAVPRTITTTRTGGAVGQHLLYESTASTHDVLLSAVRGASEMREHPQQVPDAWGMQQQLKQQPSISLREVESQEVEEMINAREEEAETTPQSGAQQRWDDYGGRNNRGSGVGVDDQQGAYMSQLAKERMEKRQQEEETRMLEQRERASARLRSLEEKMAQTEAASKVSVAAWDSRDRGITQHRSLWEPASNTSTTLQQAEKPQVEAVQATTSSEAGAATAAPAGNSGYSGPVIHLSSYEDRDRGERNTNSGPRMLYDPKSGSMVAVKSREETAACRKKERSKKTRKERELTNGHAVEEAPSSGRTSRRKAHTDPSSTAKETKTSDSKKKSSSRRLFPRTRGVLYTLDDKGTPLSADGCEGDLGYGCHSVPGGRTKNAAAYATYTKELEDKHSSATEKAFPAAYDMVEREKGSPGSDGELALYSGIRLDDTDNAAFESQDPHALEPMEWVTSSDKLDLVTGGDDSPMLKPTAKEWAPSHFALAAAAAASATRETMPTDDVPLDQSNETEDAHTKDSSAGEEGDNGLGFDPTQDMDGLMLSGSMNNDEDRLAAVMDLEALGLEPPMFGAGSKDKGNAAPRHIFSFETSGTWGNVVNEATGGSHGDWNVSSILENARPSSSAVSGLFGTGVFRSDSSTGNGGENPSDPTSFLNNITSISSWGSHRGLGGITLGGDGAKATTGD